jgi:hypothetical protein
MDNQEISALQKRLDKLEAKNRLLLWALIALLIISALLRFIPTAPSPEVQQVIKALAFEVVDVNGKKRAVLGIEADGCRTALTLYDANEKSKAKLQTYTGADDFTPIDNTSLTLSDAYGKDRVVLAEISSCQGLQLNDTSGELRASLGSLIDGSMELKLYDARGVPVFKAP